MIPYNDIAKWNEKLEELLKAEGRVVRVSHSSQKKA